MTTERPTCFELVFPRDTWGSFRPHACGKPAKFEYKGRWYCKMHHPPTADARAAAKLHCALCATLVRDGAKYCRSHESVSVPRDRYNELVEIEKSNATIAAIAAAPVTYSAMTPDGSGAVNPPRPKFSEKG